MRKGLIFLFIILLLPSVFALSVTLNSPADSNSTTATTIIFNCSVSDTQDISSVKLFTDTSGSWAQTGSTVSGNVTSASFEISSLTAGSYVWNCLAENSNSTTAYASSNFSLTITSGTSFSGTIANQSWSEDTTNSNAFDLDNYFTNPTTYSVSGNSSINVSIDGSNQVTFVPDTNWTGSETVTFTSNGVDSHPVLLNVTNVNDAPYIVGNISNQTTSINTNFTLDMTDYFADLDPNEELNYSISGSHFSLVEDGDNAIIIPETDWSGDEDVTITATDGSLSAISNEFTISIGSSSTNNTAPTLDSFSPTDNPIIELGQSVDFSISVSDLDGDSITYSWVVDSEAQSATGNSFSFTPSAEGTYTISVTASDGTTSTSRSWTITVGSTVFEPTVVDVGSILTEQTATAVCGNGIVESGETCSTCALDVACEKGYVCSAGICQEKEGLGKAIIIFLVVLFTIIVGGIASYYITTLKKSKENTEEKTYEYNPEKMEQRPPSDYTDFYKKKK